MDNIVGGSSPVELLRMQNNEGDTALHEALRNQREGMAIKMVRADPKLPFVVNNANESSFLVASKEEREEVVKEILCIDGSANSGEQQAAAISNSSSADTIIPTTALPQLTVEERRELIKMQDKTGRTALHYASWRNNTKIVHFILLTDNFHAPYIADNNGHSPLHMAVAFGMQSSMLELLKHCPDSIEQLDKSHRNALHIALLNRRHKIIRELLKLPHIGGLLNGPDKEGNTPLHLASERFTHTSLLWDRRAKLTMRNKDGQTALALSRIPRWRQQRLLPEPVWGWPQHMPHVIPVEKPTAEESTTWKRQIFMVIASLIATVSFAAAFTLPGGYRGNNESNPGTAVLATKPAFKAFVLLDTFAMCLSTAAIYCYILGWTLAQRGRAYFLIVGNALTIVACFCMLLALSAGMFVAIAPQSMWLAIAVLAICSLLPCLRLGYAILVISILLSPRWCRIWRARKRMVRIQNV